MGTRAFSFLEIIFVVAIIAVLSALLLPVFARAKRSAMQSESISNLHQCGLALSIYIEGDDIKGLPDYSAAKVLLADAPTYDRADYFRQSESDDFNQPLIGSYAYVRGVNENGYNLSDNEDWTRFLASQPDPYLLASVFYGDRKYVPFDGNDRNPCLKDMTCAFPSRLIRLKSDSSVRVSNFRSVSERVGKGTYPLFNWTSVFLQKDLQ